MKYFRIRNALKGIGSKYPQVETAVGNYDVKNQNYIGNEKYFLSKINDTPILPEPVLYKSAKLTDLISASFTGIGTGLIISDKLYSLIYKYAENTGQFFKLNVHHNNKTFDNFYYLHPLKTNNELIDFTESEIWELNSFIKVKKIELNNEKDFFEKLRITKYPKMLSIEKYVLMKSIPNFFSLNFIDGGIGFFVSEELKNAIVKENCTGIVFTESNEKYP